VTHADTPDLAHPRARHRLPHDAHRPPARWPGPFAVLHGVAVIAARLASGRQEDASLRHMVRALDATLDNTYEGARVPH